MSDALAVLGDRYSLLVVRELFYGYRRFSELAALTGAPRTLLSGRLRTLAEAGVLERRQYSSRPPRWEYVLTEAGRDLLPVVLTLREWGERHATDAPPTVVFRHGCGAELHPEVACGACGEPVAAGTFVVAGGTHPPVLRP